MAREPTTRLVVSGHRFLLRRMELALVRRDVAMVHEPLRAHRRALLMGGVLAVVALAGCALVAFIRPQDALGDAPIVMVRTSGALYVWIDDTLHPVLNLASARLIAGTAAMPRTVSERALRSAKRGALVGIPGAPSILAEPVSDAAAQWAVCDDGTGATVVVAGIGPTEPAAAALRARQAVLVQSRAEPAGQDYLLYDGKRARLTRGDVAVERALRVERTTPVAVSPAVLSAIPEVPPISAPAIPGAGSRGPATLGDMRVGSIIRVARTDSQEYYVVLADGVQRVGELAADIIRFSDSHGGTEIVTVAADAISATAISEKLPVATFPDVVEQYVREPVICARWRSGATAVLAGPAIPLAGHQVPVALASADGPGGKIDTAFVPPGRSLFVRTPALYLISDTGVRYGVTDTQAAAALGLSSTPLEAPWPILRLLPEGAELSRAAALLAYDGIDGIGPIPGATPG